MNSDSSFEILTKSNCQNGGWVATLFVIVFEHYKFALGNNTPLSKEVFGATPGQSPPVCYVLKKN
jgi:hypothetical protein